MTSTTRANKARGADKKGAKRSVSKASKGTAPAADGPLSADELHVIDQWWRASNYLSVGQIYLMDNPLLRVPLRAEHVKPRLLGHWGTTPGLTSSMHTSTGRSWPATWT